MVTSWFDWKRFLGQRTHQDRREVAVPRSKNVNASFPSKGLIRSVKREKRDDSIHDIFQLKALKQMENRFQSLEMQMVWGEMFN